MRPEAWIRAQRRRNSVNVSLIGVPSTVAWWVSVLSTIVESEKVRGAASGLAVRRRTASTRARRTSHGEGLGDVIVGPHGKAGKLIPLGSLGSEHHNGDARGGWIGAGPCGQLRSRKSPGSMRSRRMRIGVGDLKCGQCLASVQGCRRLITRFLQVDRQQIDQISLVIDNQSALVLIQAGTSWIESGQRARRMTVVPIARQTTISRNDRETRAK
jgi:hypothetical protein